MIWGVQAAASGASLIAGRPWTSLVSGRQFTPEVRAHPLFAAANRRVTMGWTLYFGLAAVVSFAAGPMWSLVLAAPTPLLGWVSYRVGNGYAAARLPSRGASAMANSRNDELRAVVRGKSDDEILAAAEAAPGGVDGLLDETMAGMRDALDPDAAEDCVVGYEIDAPNGSQPFRIEVRDGAVITERREPADARVVLRLSLPDYLRLITGELDGTQAFMAGRMKIRGDVMFATQIGRMFRTA
jgi:putative sterol carrier protein